MNSSDSTCGSNIESTDNITEELAKLLSNAKCGSKKDKSKKSKKTSIKIYKSKHDNKCSGEHKVSDSSSSESCSSDDCKSLAQIRVDILKILEMISSLKSESCKSAGILEKLEHKVKSLETRITKLEKNKDDKVCDSDVYQESLDKILSTKLDELSVKVDNKLNELSKFVNSTRNIAIMKHNK